MRRAHELQILEAHYDALTSSPGGPSRDEYRWGEHIVGYQVTAPPISLAVSLSPLPTTVATFAGIDGDSCDQLGTLLSFVAIMSAAPGLHSQAVAIPDAEKRNGPQPTAQPPPWAETRAAATRRGSTRRPSR